jgi:transglutaminase-like putative cysteine protease
MRCFVHALKYDRWMKIRFGYELSYAQAQSVPTVILLHAQPGPGQRLLTPDSMRIEPYVPAVLYVDDFGNTCSRFMAPAPGMRLTADAILEDSGVPEPEVLDAREVPVHELPHECLRYLLASRYCETDLLMNEAWRLFGQMAPGWRRVQAICDHVNALVTFGYQYARPTKTAYETYQERNGVCRDLAHLAIAFCRCLNIPARYCTSYLGDIGVPPVDAPMDFAGCMEVFLGDRWHTFDPRNNTRRIGRLMIARGRDAADVAISTTFGCSRLQSFSVRTELLTEQQAAQLLAAGDSAAARAA